MCGVSDEFMRKLLTAFVHLGIVIAMYFFIAPFGLYGIRIVVCSIKQKNRERNKRRKRGNKLSASILSGFIVIGIGEQICFSEFGVWKPKVVFLSYLNFLFLSCFRIYVLIKNQNLELGVLEVWECLRCLIGNEAVCSGKNGLAIGDVVVWDV